MTVRAVAVRALPSPGRTWRAILYLVARLPLPLAGALGVAVPTVVGGVRGLVTIGIPLLIAYLVAAVAASPLERSTLTMLGGPAIPDPHADPGERRGIAQLMARLREAATRREAVHALIAAALAPLDAAVLFLWATTSLALLLAPLLVTAGPIEVWVTIETSAQAWPAVLVGMVLLVLGAQVVVLLAELHAREARWLLAPQGRELERKVTELARSRLRLIDAFDIERRRIERDLHDGAQQQLVTLAMTLDLARIELEDGQPAEGARLVDEAHAQVTRTIGELRDLINGIHPPSLVDRGLPGAVAELADRTPLPVIERVNLPGRLPESVETAAYFVLSEALANAAKHSQATQVEIDVRLRGDDLSLTVHDDGVGGADADAGSGLAGLGDRIAAVGGRLTLSSPLGGPTVLQATIPCRGSTP